MKLSFSIIIDKFLFALYTKVGSSALSVFLCYNYPSKRGGLDEIRDHRLWIEYDTAGHFQI
jgi:hypothetical protein